MRIRQPRIQPVTEADWTNDSRPVLTANAARGPLLNVFATIARHQWIFGAMLALPTIINVDVSPTVIDQTAAHHHVRRGFAR